MSVPRPRFTRFSAVLCFLLAAASSFAQTTIYVPADQPSIQAGIDAANDGDTVFVSRGTYNENIDFKGKAIIVTSGAKAFSDAAVAATIINGTKDGPVVTLKSNEPATAVFNGFTVRNGHATLASGVSGGGIIISGGSPAITNNIVTNNIGCGVVVSLSSSLIQGNNIRQTTGDAPNSPCFYPPTTSGQSLGGGTPGTGLTIYNSVNVQVLGNTIEDNILQVLPGSELSSGAAGAYISGGTQITLQNNVIRNNNSAVFGGLSTGYPPNKLLLIQNLVYGNGTSSISGGLQVEVSGTVQPPYPAITEVNNTFYGGQKVILTFAPSVLANNIFVDPSTFPTAIDNYYGLWCPDTFSERSPLTINNNDIFNTVGAVQPSGDCPLGIGNLAVDPQFINASTSDFHTQLTSPVGGAGDITAPVLPPADFDGKNRTVCGTVDMGVYQHHPHPPIVLTATPNPTPGRSAVTLSATLTGNCNTPTGAVTFFDGAAALGTATINPNGVATFTTSFLFVGTHTLTAHYPGDFNFEDGTSNAVTEIITGPPTTTVLTTVTPNPALPFQAITMAATVSSAYTVPAGTMTFFAGSTALATVPVAPNGYASTVVSALGAGTYGITAVYNGSTEYAASTSNSVTLVVLPAPSATTLTAQPNPVYQGQTVTFAASTAGTSPSATAATGIMSFFDSATLLGTASLSGGHATFATDALAIGSHTITAVYSGDANYAPSTSSDVIEVVLASSFTISLSPARLAFTAGQPQAVTVTLTSIGNYAGTLQLGTGPLPLYASASFSPASVALTAGGTSTSVMTLLTTTPLVRAEMEDRHSALPIALAGLAGLPLLLLRRARRLPNLLAILLACAALTSLAGCGSVRFAANSVAPGTYIIPVTATDTQSHTVHTASLTLEVVR